MGTCLEEAWRYLLTATRLVATVFASLVVYVFGELLIFQLFYQIGLENTAEIPEWKPPIVLMLAFLVVTALFPLAPVAFSTILARQFGAPAVATAGVTAVGIVMLWLWYFMVLAR